MNIMNIDVSTQTYVKDVSYRYFDIKKAKIVLIGDIHGRTDVFNEITELVDGEVDFGLQTGDIEDYRVEPLVPVYFVKGNHENFDLIQAIETGKLRIDYFHIIPAGVVVSIGNILVAGLGGSYSPKWKPRPRNISKEEFKAAKSVGQVDILLTHEAPVGLIKKDGKDCGCEIINELMEAVNPKYLICGHNHIKAVKDLNGTRVISMPYAWEEYAVLDFASGNIEWRKT